MEFFVPTVAHFFFKSHFTPWSYSSSHSYLYSILFLTLLYILILFTQLGRVCLPTFWLFCFLFVCLWFGLLVSLFVCCFCGLVFLSLLVFFCFAGTTRHFPIFPHITSGEQRNSKATSLQIGFQEYQTNHHPNTKNTLQTICRACQMRKGHDNPGRVSV